MKTELEVIASMLDGECLFKYETADSREPKPTPFTKERLVELLTAERAIAHIAALTAVSNSRAL